jgi:hypothetical protein
MQFPYEWYEILEDAALNDIPMPMITLDEYNGQWFNVIYERINQLLASFGLEIVDE